MLGYWPQGRSMGVDLRALLADRELTCFISETIQSVRDYLGVEENALAVGMRLAREAGRERDYGFMLHYCDAWGGDIARRRKGVGRRIHLFPIQRQVSAQMLPGRTFKFLGLYIQAGSTKHRLDMVGRRMVATRTDRPGTNFHT